MATKAETEDKIYSSWDRSEVYENQLAWEWENIVEKLETDSPALDLRTDIEQDVKFIKLIKDLRESKKPDHQFQEFLKGANPELYKLLDKAIEKMAQNDDDYQRFAWDDLCEDLTNLMKEIQPHGNHWCASVNNFGWRHQNGAKEFKADDGEKFLQEVLPYCECSFQIYNRGDHIEINNAHHDAPTGGEIYYIYPQPKEIEND